MAIGCARHSAFLYDRGGRHRLGQIEPLTSVSWERVRDDMSFGGFTSVFPTWECQDLLSRAEPNRHELVIFRDGERVWEGPLSLLTLTTNQVTGQARDVLYYPMRTVCHADYSNANPNVATTLVRASGMLTAELARKEALDPPINVLPYLTSLSTTFDSQTSRTSLAYQSTVFDDMDDMAAKSGLDYTVVGRRILLFDTHTVFHTTPTVDADDFLDSPVVSVYGMEGATTSYATDGQGGWGVAGGPDPYYGEWEITDAAYEEGSSADLPSQAELNSQALRNLSQRNPVPVVVRIPDNTSLSPRTRLTVEHLVPGVRIPLRIVLGRRTLVQTQKLDRVVFKETKDGETVSVTMSTAPLTAHEVGS